MIEQLLDEVSDMDLFWTNPFEELSIFAKVAIGITLCFAYIFGFVIIRPILSFEKHGGDPQKRGLKNQVDIDVICFLRSKL